MSRAFHITTIHPVWIGLLFWTFIGVSSGQKTITQGYVWGVKGGGSYLTQKGHYRTGGTTIGWHADIFYDSYSSESANSLYFQLGYHQRGSGLSISYRNSLHNIQIPSLRLDNPRFLYYNASVEAGVKKRYPFGEKFKTYMGLGLRGAYTFGTNLEKYRAINEEYKAPIYPSENFVRHYQYGVSLLGGMEFPLASELYEGFVELRLCQDMSIQYFQPGIPGGGFRDPYTNEQRDLPEISARNFSIELSTGIRIFRVYEYEE